MYIARPLMNACDLSIRTLTLKLNVLSPNVNLTWIVNYNLCTSDIFVAVIKYLCQDNLKKSLFGLIVSEQNAKSSHLEP